MLRQKSVLILVLVYVAACGLVYTFAPAEYALASNAFMVPGAPLKGVDVRLGRNSGDQAATRATKSDENGNFTFSDVPAGSYDLTLTFPESRQDTASKSKTFPISIALTGVEGGKLSKDVEFVQEVPSSSARAGKAKYKNIVLKIQVSGNGPLTGVVTERASAIRMDQKIYGLEK